MVMEVQSLGEKRSPIQAKPGKMQRLMTAASAGAIALAAPNVIISPAHAQALPSGCTDAVTTGTPNNANGDFDAGETITCLSPPDPISSITTAVEDITIVVGSDDTATNVSDLADNGIFITGGGTVDIRNAASTVYGEQAGVYLGNTDSISTDLTLVSEGTINSDGLDAVSAVNLGSTNTSISVNNATSADYNGIFAYKSPGAGNLDITATGTVSGGRDGVRAYSSGTGAITISVNAVDAVADGVYVYADAANTGGVSVTATGTIDGVGGGLDITNDGSGSTSVEVVDVYASGSASIGIEVSHYGADLDIDADGTIEAGDAGVEAANNGTGATTISVANVDSGGVGLYVYTAASTTGDVTVTSSGLIDAVDGGVDVTSNGSGSTFVGVVDVYTSGSASTGVRVSSNGVDLEIDADGTIEAGGAGVEAYNNGTGATTVSVTAVDSGDVGVYVYAAASTTDDVTVTASGLIDAVNGGVDVDNNGTGSTFVSVGDVYTSGAVADAVNVSHDGADLEIISTGMLDSGRRGVAATNNGTGATTISVNNIEAAYTGVDLFAASTTTGDVSVTATGTITADRDGVAVSNNGTGATTVSVNAVDSGSIGLNIAAGGSGNGDMSVTATGTIRGDDAGVALRQNGSGSVYANVADVYATTVYGVNIRNYGVDLEFISTGTVDAGTDGLIAENGGTGATTVSVNNVDAGDDGVIVYAGVSTTGDVSLTATGTITAGGAGVEVDNEGTGATVVSVNVVDAGSIGVDVYAGTSNTGDMSVTATGRIDAVGFGVAVSNRGSGSAYVSVADIYASGSGSIGVWANNYGADLEIVSTGTLTASDYGVHAINNGTGATTVSVNNVDSGYTGVEVYAAASTTGDVSVTATGVIDAVDFGLDIDNDGSGSTSVSVVDVYTSGTGSVGIEVTSDGADLDVASTGTVTAGDYGVYAANNGTGATSVSVNNIDAGGAGVQVYAGASTAGDVSVTATGAITSDYNDGVNIENLGTGATTVSVNNVNAGDLGVRVTSGPTTTGDVTITANGDLVSYGDDGVEVRNDGSGALTISVVDVTSIGGIGGDHAVDIDTSGADLTVVSTGTLSAYSDGVNAIHDGTGNVDLRLNNITTVDGDGVDLITISGSSTVDLRVEASGLIDAGGYGVNIINRGTGGTTIEVNNITAGNDGVRARNDVTTTGDLSVTAIGVITAGADGVDVDQEGTGAAIISVNDVTAYDGAGVYVYSGSAADLVSITATGSISAYGTGGGESGVGVLRRYRRGGGQHRRRRHLWRTFWSPCRQRRKWPGLYLGGEHHRRNGGRRQGIGHGCFQRRGHVDRACLRRHQRRLRSKRQRGDGECQRRDGRRPLRRRCRTEFFGNRRRQCDFDWRCLRFRWRYSCAEQCRRRRCGRCDQCDRRERLRHQRLRVVRHRCHGDRACVSDHRQRRLCAERRFRKRGCDDQRCVDFRRR